MKFTVEFKNVGRGKMCWTETLNEMSERTILGCIKRKGALMSKGIDLWWDDESTGNILAGGRKVGTFELIEVLA